MQDWSETVEGGGEEEEEEESLVGVFLLFL